MEVLFDYHQKFTGVIYYDAGFMRATYVLVHWGQITLNGAISRGRLYSNN